MNAFSETFPNAAITGYFFHYSQRLWRKVQDLKLTRLVSRNTSSNDFSDDDKKLVDQWFLATIGLAPLIALSLVESVWTEAMDIYTPESRDAEQFNDYMVKYYVYQNLHALPTIFGMSTITFETGDLTQIMLLKVTITEYLLYFFNILILTTLFVDSRMNMNINVTCQKRVKCN